MKSEQELRVLDAIQNELLKELLKHSCDILIVLEDAVKKSEFAASRYKEQECYDKLLKTKRGYNILKYFLEVMSHEKIDCPEEGPYRDY